MPNLTSLDLSKNRINNIPPSIGDLKTLQELFLANNKLFFTPLTPRIGALSALQRLDLSFNQLEGIIPEIGNLPNLVYE